MILNSIQVESIYIACGYHDMRKSITGLATIVEQVFKLDPFSNVLYLFCGKQSDRLKALLWEGDGFILFYKRLERGGRFKWPRSGAEARKITQQQLRWLLEGLNIEQPKAIKTTTSITLI